MTDVKLAPYITPYKNRKNFCRKVRDTEKKIKQLEKEGEWKEVSNLKHTLRNAWWGYRRYK